MGSLSPNLGLTIPTVGGDTGPLFAQEINGDLSILDFCLGGVNTLNVGGKVNVTLTAQQAQNLVQQFAGVLTGNITVFAPAVGRFYAVENATTGAFSLSFGCTGGGNAQVIPQGLSTWLWTDGSFTRLSNPPGWQEIATYSVSGAATVVVLLPPPFRRFRLTLQGMGVNSVGGEIALQGSTNGGSSFVGTGYQSVSTTSAGSAVTVVSASGAAIPISPTLNSNNTGWDATVEIWPGNTALSMTVRSFGCGENATPTFATQIVGATSDVRGANAVQIAPILSSSITGTIIVEGLP